MLKQEVEIADYASALKVLFRFISTFESGLIFLIEKTPLSEIYVERLPLLQADLETLNEIVPICADLPHAASTLEDACGLVYVMEGASLGSAVIRRHLRTCLGNDLPIRYFGLYAENPDHWETVTRRLVTMLPDHASAARAAGSAADAFSILISMAK